VRPLRPRECRPNVAGIGPGNCIRGLDSVTCGHPDANCRGQDLASNGFMAPTLTDEFRADDAVEGCDHAISDSRAVAPSSPDQQGNQAATVIEVPVKGKCGKTTKMDSKDIDTYTPVVMGLGSGSSSLMSSLSSSSLSALSSGGSLSGSGSVIGSSGSINGLQLPLSGSSSGSSLSFGPSSSSASQSGSAAPVNSAVLQSAVQSAVSKVLSASMSAIQSLASQSASGSSSMSGSGSGSQVTPIAPSSVSGSS